MRWPHSRARAQWLAPICCLVLAFQLTSAVQQTPTGNQPLESSAGAHEHVGQPGPMLSMGSESSSALESSAALAGDDLIAAESSQAPAEQAEHKAFTSAQLLRQDTGQQVAASVAPVFGPAPGQQQQLGPQQQLYHPQHLAALQARHKAAFNPFMAAALAGNYGPQQQQMAAAAAARMEQAVQHHGPPGHHQAQQHALPHVMPGHQPQQVNHQHVQHAHQHQPAPGSQQQQMAVQESVVRHNVVSAPSYSAPVDANSIELGDAAQSAPAGPQQQQVALASQALASAASAQHPVIASASGQEAQAWPLQAPDIPKIVNLEVKCEKNLMKVSIEFDKIFNGVIFSKGHYSQGQCVHVGQNSGKQQAYFDISINTCGTQGNTQNGLYGMGGNTGSGTFFENTIVIQYDPNVQEVYDHARKLRCTWHDQYEKAVTFRPFPVDMLDIVRADFAGDNVGCWMQIQVGKGPWASEVAGIVKIGQTMTMVLAIKDEENKFDMLVRNCFAHDGKRGPIELVDKSGCITRPKLMSRFTKIKNFGSSATVLSYAHFQAFKFPDSMEVHFQCTIQICRHQCPDQCSAGPAPIGGPNSGESYSESTISGTFNIHGAQGGVASAAPNNEAPGHLRKYGAGLQRDKRDLSRYLNGSQPLQHQARRQLTKSVGLNRVIQVVSTGDLAFAVQQQQVANVSQEEPSAQQLARVVELSNQICMSSYNFVLALVLLVLVLLCSCLLAISLYVRQRSYLAAGAHKLKRPSQPASSPVSGYAGKQLLANAADCASSASSASSTLIRGAHVPSPHQLYHPQSNHQHLMR